MENKTLIIYDLNGTIIQQVTGFYKVPNGIPCIEVEIPEGKRIAGVNVELQEAILEDIPKSGMEILQEKVALLEDSQKAILRGDMQILAYNLYPEDFEDVEGFEDETV